MPVKKLIPSQGAKQIKQTGLSLPMEKTKPETDLSRYAVFIYGMEGIGKTSLSARFPDAIHFMFEPGHRSSSVYAVEPENWEQVEEYVDLLSKDTTNKFKNVIFDTVDLVFDMLVDHICNEFDIDALKDIGFGDGYRMARTRFLKLLSKIDKRYGIVLLSHAKEPSDDGDGSRITSTAMKTCRSTLAKWCAITGYYYIDESGARKLRVRPNTWCEAKMRIENRFNFSDGTPVDDIPMGKNPNEAYNNFIKAFQNTLDKPKKSITLKLKKGA